MSKDDIIEMARQAGMVQDGDVWFSANNYEQSDVHTAELEAFAKLVEDKVRQDIIEKNAPVIKVVNAHIKALEDLLKEKGEA